MNEFDVFVVSITHDGFDKNQAACVDMWWSRGADLAPSSVSVNGAVLDAPVRKLAEPEPEEAEPVLEAALSSSGLGLDETAAPPTAMEPVKEVEPKGLDETAVPPTTMEPVKEVEPKEFHADIFMPEEPPLLQREPAETIPEDPPLLRREPAQPERDLQPKAETSEARKNALADKEAYLRERAERQGKTVCEEAPTTNADSEDATRIAQLRGYADAAEMEEERIRKTQRDEDKAEELTSQERAAEAKARETARLKKAADDDKAAFLAERAKKRADAAAAASAAADN